MSWVLNRNALHSAVYLRKCVFIHSLQGGEILQCCGVHGVHAASPQEKLGVALDFEGASSPGDHKGLGASQWLEQSLWTPPWAGWRGTWVLCRIWATGTHTVADTPVSSGFSQVAGVLECVSEKGCASLPMGAMLGLGLHPCSVGQRLGGSGSAQSDIQ